MNLNIAMIVAAICAVVGVSSVGYSIAASLEGDLTAFVYMPIGALVVLIGALVPAFVEKHR